jgi:hypothetical protein
MVSHGFAYIPLCLLCALGTVHGGSAGGTSPRIEVPPAKVRSVVQGVYEVRKAGGEVGRENFIRTYFTNNTAVYESVFEVAERSDVNVSGNNKLEVEEDSGFPLSYYTSRRTDSPHGEWVREVSVEVYSGVAVVSERQNGNEKREVVGLPAGCLFIEGNTAHQLRLVLDRYDRTSGGKQAFRAFDPMGVGVTTVALEATGDTLITGVEGPKGSGTGPVQVAHYRYFTGAAFAADVFVDARGEIARIDAPLPAELEYLLVSREERNREGSPNR